MAATTSVQGCSQICSLRSVDRRTMSDKTSDDSHCSAVVLRKHGLALPLPRRLSIAAPRVASNRSSRLVARAVGKAPPGVEAPRQEPKLPSNFIGFTENAEVYNSRAAMIGIFGIVAVEFFANRGILEILGITVGKGLDLPL